MASPYILIPEVPPAPRIPLMFALMLYGQLVIAHLMLVLQLAMELTMFAPRQPLFVSLFMLIVEVLVVVVVLFVDLVVLAIVPVVPAILIVAVALVAITVASAGSDRDGEGRSCGRRRGR